MRVMVVGALGMLGHALCEVLAERCEVVASIRPEARLPRIEPFARVVGTVPLDALADPAEAVASARPDAVVNAAGVTRPQDPAVAGTVNGVFPHRLAEACDRVGARLVHISTDCVFSGSRGAYRETDPPDPTSVYGRSKLAGEVDRAPHVTLRTSFIGRELAASRGLLEWFYSRRGGTAPGWSRARFSGLTTHALAAAIGELLLEPGPLPGLLHLAGEPISKLDLLQRLERRLRLGVMVEPDDQVAIDRSLDASLLARTTSIVVPPWDEMLDGLARLAPRYDGWR